MATKKKELNERDAKLVQWLNEAYAKEAELEADLTAHISLTQKAPFSGFLGAGGNEENGQNKRYDSEQDFCLHVEEDFDVT